MEKPLLYLAAPLFNPGERAFNAMLASQLEEHLRVFLPQRDGALLSDLLHTMPPKAAQRRIFNADVAAINACAILLLVMDGRTVDEGACVELGMAHALGKICWGLKTDSRSLLGGHDNPLITSALTTPPFRTPAALLAHAIAFTAPRR